MQGSARAGELPRELCGDHGERFDRVHPADGGDGRGRLVGRLPAGVPPWDPTLTCHSLLSAALLSRLFSRLCSSSPQPAAWAFRMSWRQPKNCSGGFGGLMAWFLPHQAIGINLFGCVVFVVGAPGRVLFE